MNLVLSVSMARAAIVLLSWAFIAILASVSWSPYGIIFILFGAPAALSMHFRHENVDLDEMGNLSIRGIFVKKSEILYIYEDPGCIIIKTVNSSRKFMFFGFYSIRPRVVLFQKIYIKNSGDLSNFIKRIPADRRDFLFSRLLYYFNPF